MNRSYSETEVVARVRGLTVTRLRAFVAAECVRPEEHSGRLTFREADVARVRLVNELAADFELDEEAAAMVLSLIDQIHGLRRELRLIAEAVSAEPEDVRKRVQARVAGG